MEAADLGVRLCQEFRSSVYFCYLFPAIPVAAFCLASIQIANWLPTLLLWCAKPWLDRSILFALSRAAFGQQSSWRDLWRERRTVWRKQLIGSLTLRRLSPWRSLTQPVYQLEGLSGGVLRKRVKQVRSGKTGSAMLMTSAFGFVEYSFLLALISLLVWFAPPNRSSTVLDLFANDAGGDRFALILATAYCLTILFLEPFYVAAGFGMYLSRRVELEAWDIEQELRRAFA
jgi:hypothetical protein